MNLKYIRVTKCQTAGSGALYATAERAVRAKMVVRVTPPPAGTTAKCNA